MIKIFKNLAGRLMALIIDLLTNRILYVFIVVSVVSLLSLFVGNKNEVAPKYLNNPDEAIVQASDYFKIHPQDLKEAAIFDVGLYVESIYSLDLANLSFKARGDVWYTWTEEPLIDGKMESKDTIGVFGFNLIEDSSSSQAKPLSKPFIEDGHYWDYTSFDAKFNANKINLRNFPFDKQKLQIIVTDIFHETDDLILYPVQFRLPSKAFNILGYKLDGITLENTVRVFSSNYFDDSNVNWQDRISFGEHSQSAASTQSQLIFSIDVSRAIFASIFQYIAPLLIVCILGTTVSFLDADDSEIKLGAPPAAILSLIFLQDSFMDALPRTSYLTCMDLLFLIAYLACFLTFINSLLERLDRNYFRYAFLFKRLGILVVLASPFAIKTWLEFNA